MAARVAPFGTWSSPLDAATAAGLTLSLSEVWGSGDSWYWLEGRPQEGGRQVIVRLGPDGSTSDVNAPPWNARTRVHEYGGGAYTVVEGVAYFSHFGDMRVYRLALEGGAERVRSRSLRAGALRFADFTADRVRGRLIAVNEDHTDPQTPPGGKYPEPTNRLAAFATDPGAGEPATPDPRRGRRLLQQPAGESRRCATRLDRMAPPAHALGRQRGVGRAVRCRRAGSSTRGALRADPGRR